MHTTRLSIMKKLESEVRRGNMSQLSRYLPPFSSDYSGICSSLFDLDGMVVIHDAHCCSMNYVNMDEPRWYGNKKPIFSSGLREIDAIMGDDDKLIRKIIKAYHELNPEFIAILGSPVPTIVGADMAGIAQELENKLEIPVFGFSSTGLRYYNRGISETMIKLTKRYAQEGSKVNKSVNILGLNALDFSDSNNAEDIREVLKSAGWKVSCSFMMGCSIAEIINSPRAAVNVVVSQSGMDLAEYMERTWGIPYVAFTPMGLNDNKMIFSIIEKAFREGKSRVIRSDDLYDGEILIIGEQLIANSIREVLASHYGVKGVTVGCLFGKDKRLATDFDIDLKSELQIARKLKENKYTVVIGDPLLKALVDKSQARLFSLPHVAVSSKLYWHQYPTFVGDEMENFISAAFKASKK
ncbi:hypothetical protein GH807_07200 [Acetobacterium tundrae]|uniref:Nitrogenase/oxidoreductase component 1 domain-containing protein n=2 Tax=Acetobacterium tundrae TaxID=132932 RepID=A0ABR6WKS0_9FIRM|nr:hypothetical protein [Acetobacterium tundrae]